MQLAASRSLLGSVVRQYQFSTPETIADEGMFSIRDNGYVGRKYTNSVHMEIVNRGWLIKYKILCNQFIYNGIRFIT